MLDDRPEPEVHQLTPECDGHHNRLDQVSEPMERLVSGHPSLAGQDRKAHPFVTACAMK
jgi:hypothetical protein